MALVVTAAYSFEDVNCIIEAPGGLSLILSEEQVADEGFTVAMTGDQSTMTTGATRGAMHSLHANRSGRITMRYLKTSPMLKKLVTMMNFQFSTGANHGQNIITVSNKVFGDEFDCTGCAFVRYPDTSYAKTGNVMEIMLDCGDIARQIGDGTLRV